MQLNLAAEKGNTAGTLEVSDQIFDCKFNEALVHQVVTAYLACVRQGTHAQKNRSAVSGGGKKPWRQKGTGRARAGTARSPIWRKGGVTFAAQSQDYSQKINKKMYRGAMRSILSELLRQKRLLVVEKFGVNSHKTRELLAKLRELEIERGLLIADIVDENLYLASRNIPHVNICDVEAIDPASLVAADKVLITVSALKQFEEVLA